MPGKSSHVKNEKQYEALKDKGMSKERAAKIANSPTRRGTAARSRTPAAATRRRAAPMRRRSPPAERAGRRPRSKR